MVSAGENNPRGPFGEVVFLSVSRDSYDEKGRSRLFVEVGFSEARVGAEMESPVRFTLSLKRANVRIRPDAARALKIDEATVVRKPPIEGKRTRTVTQTSAVEVDAGVRLDPTSAMAKLSAGAKGKLAIEDVVQFAQTIGDFSVRHWLDADGGCTFILEPGGERTTLKDSPWLREVPRLAVHDLKHPRGRGEPPEPLVEIRCAIEDLEIARVEYKTKPKNFFERMPAAKRAAAIQYIRHELGRHGLEMGASDDKYAVITLADATPNGPGT